jgi:hypothetical protein
MNKIVGVIYPVPLQFVDRLLLENRYVFVKYLPKISGLKIVPKHKVLFYRSHSSKDIVGEGKIEQISFQTPEEALERYGNKLFLNKEELMRYVFQQPKRDQSKKLLVLVLSNIKRYSTPKKFKKPISMAGRYLTQRELKELVG